MRMISLLILTSLLAAALVKPTFATDGAVAYAHYIRGNYADAYREYRGLAEVGYPRYQNLIASMHAKGEGVKKDLTQAYAWYALSASQGDLLGRMNIQKLSQELTSEQLQLSIKLAKEYGKMYVAPYRPQWKLQ